MENARFDRNRRVSVDGLGTGAIGRSQITGVARLFSGPAASFKDRRLRPLLDQVNNSGLSDQPIIFAMNLSLLVRQGESGDGILLGLQRVPPVSNPKMPRSIRCSSGCATEISCTYRATRPIGIPRDSRAPLLAERETRRIG